MTIRQERTAGRIREIMSEVLLTEVSDPRLIGVTVTDVKIDRELRHAHIYVVVLGAEADEDVQALEGLERAKGFLRSALAARLQSRVTPYLYFHWDRQLENASRIEDLLAEMDIPDEDVNPIDPDLQI
ncbi:MAG TPA: 30S ribosome-binding factor RbfA [Anaerolineae bacterium]|nr:30S ribosome-binding factor RbfA [Anaerolineae bacterium]